MQDVIDIQPVVSVPLSEREICLLIESISREHSYSRGDKKTELMMIQVFLSHRLYVAQHPTRPAVTS